MNLIFNQQLWRWLVPIPTMAGSWVLCQKRRSASLLTNCPPAPPAAKAWQVNVRVFNDNYLCHGQECVGRAELLSSWLFQARLMLCNNFSLPSTSAWSLFTALDAPFPILHPWSFAGDFKMQTGFYMPFRIPEPCLGNSVGGDDRARVVKDDIEQTKGESTARRGSLPCAVVTGLFLCGFSRCCFSSCCRNTSVPQGKAVGTPPLGLGHLALLVAGASALGWGGKSLFLNVFAHHAVPRGLPGLIAAAHCRASGATLARPSLLPNAERSVSLTAA